MEITGEVTYVGAIESGVSAKGNQWRKQSFVLVYQKGQYPNEIMLDTFDDKVIGKIEVGQTLNVKFDFTVRDYKRKDGTPIKINNINVWEMHCLNKPSAQQQIFKEPNIAEQTAAKQQPPVQASNDDDLPF